MKKLLCIGLLYFGLWAQSFAQKSEDAQVDNEPTKKYKKRVLESIEVDFLTSLYNQNGDNAAVTGGIGTEELTDATAAIVVSIPLNDDDVLTIDAGVSAYTSASSSNVNPFDERATEANAFVASSGESSSDVWSSANVSFARTSDDRNRIWSANLGFAAEYDYNSIGGGGSYTWLFNQRNTEFSLKGSIYLDRWGRFYPAELTSRGGRGFDISRYIITGNTDYNPNFEQITSTTRNSYNVGIGFSQILSKRMQGSLALDVVLQDGLLSTPFQRVYFEDIEDSFIEDFHLADDIERMPSSRLKLAIGGRLNYYLNDRISLRTFYRYYQDDWDLKSHTASIEIPIKFAMGQWTVYPSYRFYNQTAVKYFKPYNQHLSTSEFYTSDYDLSKYHAHQFGMGVSYNDLYSKMKWWIFDIGSIDLKYYHYQRNSTFNSNLVTIGIKIKI